MKTRLSVLAFMATLTIGVAAFLSLSPLKVLAAANNCLWSGAVDDMFNNMGNWSNCGGTVPQTGDNLVFDNSALVADAMPNNDISGGSFGSITFQGSGSYNVSVTGNAMTITGGITNTGTSLLAGLDTALTISGSQTLDTTSGDLFIDGALSGSGNLNITGTQIVAFGGDNSAYTGSITVTSGSLWVYNVNGLGNAVGTTTVVSGAQLQFVETTMPANPTIAEPFFLAGNGNGLEFTNYALGAMKCFSNSCTEDVTMILSGPVTLTANTEVWPGYKLRLTGGLSGNYTLKVGQGLEGLLSIEASSNSTMTANGSYNAPTSSTTLSDNQPGVPLSVLFNETVILDGTRQMVSVSNGGILMGNGTVVGQLNVGGGGRIAPGHSPGCLASGNLSMSGTLDEEIGGTTACTGYDQINVTGTVDLTSGILNTSLYNSYKPATGEKYTIINNDGVDAVTGTFNTLAEGATFTVNGYVFKISYVGGSGNDVELTVQSVPAAPATGFILNKTNPLYVVAITAVVGTSLLLLSRRYQRGIAK